MSGVVASAIAMMWAALVVELAGFAVDAVWHGLLHPDFEPVSRGQVLAHLATVHAVFLIGVAVLLLSTAWAVVAGLRAGRPGWRPSIALGGAIVQVTGQTWDLIQHTRLSHGGPAAWAMIVLGPVIVMATLVTDRRRDRDRSVRRGPARLT